MRFDFGRHKDDTVEYVMLEDPGYIKWGLDEPRPSQITTLNQLLCERLINR